MASITGGIPFIGFISPTDEGDSYPVTDPKYGLGGLRTVGLSSDLNFIPYPRREEGMMVFVADENKYYYLVDGTGNENWQELSLGGGSVGPKGDRGFQGFQGLQGFQGSQGVQGFQGNQGFQGFQGPTYAFVFPTDLTANIAEGKTFGRYVRGDTIPAAGKTIEEVINLALNEDVPPTVSLSSSPPSILFNNTNPTITLNFSYNIESPPPAGVSGVSLEYRLGSSGSWTVLTSDVNATSFTHTPSLSFNTDNLNYRYFVSDTVGQTAYANSSVTQLGYSAPTVSITITGTNISSPETHYLRERGNTASQISAVINKQSTNVPLTSWGYQYRLNNSGSWIDILTGQTISGDPASFNVPTQSHSLTSDQVMNSAKYRIVVTDSYQTNTFESTQITFNNYVFYGPVSSLPQTSSEVRAASGKKLSSQISGGFTFGSGTTLTSFFFGLPTNITMSTVFDSQGIPLTDSFDAGFTSFNVQDYSGNNKSYNIYGFTQSIPYNPQIIFEVTTSGSAT